MNGIVINFDTAPANESKWRIDLQAGRPILVYENCSVIQDEQAYFILGLLRDFYAKKQGKAT